MEGEKLDKVVFTTLSSHPAVKKGEKCLSRKNVAVFLRGEK